LRANSSRPGPLNSRLLTKRRRLAFRNRELVVDLRSLTAISSDGKDVLLLLMHGQVKFLCGVYVKEVLKQLGRKRRGSLRDSADECTDSDI
jgi:hypothetical protein